ncbi:MAG: type II toxin-antitoxin system HicB family antitoxin [Halalkalicoccus sp.]
MSVENPRRITLQEENDGWWSAIDEETGVASQGPTREEALENLDEAVGLHKDEIGEPIEDEEAFLREIGIDPEEVEGERKIPEFMK